MEPQVSEKKLDHRVVPGEQAGSADNVKAKHQCIRPDICLLTVKDLQGLRNEIDRRRVPAEEAESADEVDYAVLNCNLGIVSLQLKQYSTSAGRLEKMFRNIEPVDEFVGSSSQQTYTCAFPLACSF